MLIVQNQSPTRLQCAQDVATVVPVNDTRTQCTTSLPPIKERLPSDAQRMVKNPNKKLNPETIKELAPHQPRHQLSQWLRSQCTTYRTIHAGSARRTRLPPARRPPNKHWSFSRKLACGLILPEPPSTLLLVSSGPASMH